MVDLNDEDAVHRRAMYMLEQHRLDEWSAKSARQGVQLVYRRHGEHSFFLDVARRALYGPTDEQLQGRLRDHSFQVRRDPAYAEARALSETAGAGSNFVPPVYIQSEFEAAAHPLRSTADVWGFEISAKTNQIIIPAFTSGSSSGIDSTQNQTLVEGDPVDTTISSNVTTVASKVVVLRQLLDQSSPDSRIDEVISADLGAAYGAQRDLSVLTAAGGTGALTGLLSVSGAPTVGAGSSVAGLLDGIATGYQVMIQNRYRKPNVCIMHPRRWLSGFANAVDLQGRPLALPSTHPAALVGTAMMVWSPSGLGCGLSGRQRAHDLRFGVARLRDIRSLP